MIIDTDVLIWYLRGNAHARKIIFKNIPFNISVITYLELVQGIQNKKELGILRKQLKEWPVGILHINESISGRAMFLVENFFLSHSMESGDALIAATALETNEILLTANDKHYGFIPNLHMEKFRAG